MTTHTVVRQQANVSQQSNSADTRPTIFDLREGHDEGEDHGIRVIRFYVGDDDDDDADEPGEEGENLIGD